MTNDFLFDHKELELVSLLKLSWFVVRVFLKASPVVLVDKEGKP